MAENGLPKYFEIMRVREKHKLWKTAYRSVFIRRRDLDAIPCCQKLIFAFEIRRVLNQGAFGEYLWRKVESSKGLRGPAASEKFERGRSSERPVKA